MPASALSSAICSATAPIRACQSGRPATTVSKLSKDVSPDLHVLLRRQVLHGGKELLFRLHRCIQQPDNAARACVIGKAS